MGLPTPSRLCAARPPLARDGPSVGFPPGLAGCSPCRLWSSAHQSLWQVKLGKVCLLPQRPFSRVFALLIIGQSWSVLREEISKGFLGLSPREQLIPIRALKVYIDNMGEAS